MKTPRHMSIEQIATAVSGCRLLRFQDGGSEDRCVTSIELDSRLAVPGALFFAIPGTKTDGRDYAADAVARGAVAVVCEQEIPGLEADQLVVPDARIALAELAAVLYGPVDKQMRLVGVTGTNGKTTTVRLIAAMFAACGYDAASLGTLGATLNNEPVDLNMSRPTTPEAHELRAALSELQENGADLTAMEVSSHALELKRVWGLAFKAGVFTNLTEDHLDFHADMEAYFAAKVKLFENLAPDAMAVINVDDPYGRRLSEITRGMLLTYGWSEDADIRVLPGMEEAPIRGDVATPVGVIHLDMPLVGRFNVANTLAAVGVGLGLGLTCEEIGRGLATATPVPGRFEPVMIPERTDMPHVIVDYAHTPDALENVLQVAGDLARNRAGKLWCVVGCGGDRDRQKRPIMGAIAFDHSDKVVFTSDNPRTEIPVAIIDDIVAGVTSANGYERITDRHEAILHAVRCAGPDDVVVIAGKGHEPYQEIQGVKHPFDDRIEAENALKQRILS